MVSPWNCTSEKSRSQIINRMTMRFFLQQKSLYFECPLIECGDHIWCKDMNKKSCYKINNACMLDFLMLPKHGTLISLEIVFT